jgi:hypothetical protein
MKTFTAETTFSFEEEEEKERQQQVTERGRKDTRGAATLQEAVNSAQTKLQCSLKKVK